ncbi:MAG: ABC transporter ATP-binding protein [Clostridia bacterium]|nr:ABC transporter ATP-binding protein [Clostridia bacterium]
MMPRGGHGGGKGPHGPMEIEKAKDTKGTLSRIVSYLGKSKKSIALVLALVVVGTLANLGGTYLIRPIIDEMSSGNAINYTRLLTLLACLMALYAFFAVSQWAQNHVLARVSQETVMQMRRDMFEKMQLLPIKFFDSHTHGELMSRTTNDVDTVSQTLSMTIAQVFSSAITLIGTLCFMIYVSPILTLITLVTVPLMLFVTRTIAKYTRRYYKEQQRTLGDLNGHIEENIAGVKAVKVFCHEKQVIEEFERRNSIYCRNATKAQIISGVVAPMMGMFNNMSYAITAFVGGLLALSPVAGFAALSIGSVVVFLNYSGQFSRPINELANLFATVQSAIAGAERVFEIMDTPNEYIGDDALPEIGHVEGRVDIANICFGYVPDRQILKNVTINARMGQTVALVGPTGAGKTTIVNLLTRFYDVDSGAIKIDDVDIRTVRKNSLRSKVAIVLQDTHMFSESVRENIRYGKLDASDEDVESAARLANCHEFITRLHDGYDTVLTDDASNISQGQRQMLSIARAMLADPDILILDEATSSVDTRTEIKIQEAMRNLMYGRTCFVIAHRLSTIREADKIVVINDGMVVEQGTHEELLLQKGMYEKLYNSQFDE